MLVFTVPKCIRTYVMRNRSLIGVTSRTAYESTCRFLAAQLPGIDGKPYFIHFRPTWHNPHKISNEDLEIYKGFAERLETVEARIDQMKKSGQDTFDIELELKLAKDKLKQGRFRMAQIYITSLEQHLNIKKGG